jgi:hypothetical protein
VGEQLISWLKCIFEGRSELRNVGRVINKSLALIYAAAEHLTDWTDLVSCLVIALSGMTWRYLLYEMVILPRNLPHKLLYVR